MSRLAYDWKTVVCRPALPMDTPDVLRLTAKIWDGHDYVPQVWESWLADPSLLTVVAEYGGRVVGLYCLARQGPGEWWLQGLRVDPDYQGRGIASRLHDYMLAHWQSACDGVLRLGTSEKRLPVQHLCQRSGFRKVGAYRWYQAAALEMGGHSFRPVQPSEIPRAVQAAVNNPLSELCFGLMDLGWEWAAPTPERMAAAVERGRAYWWEPGAGLLVLGEDDEGPELFPAVQLCACALERLPALLGEYRWLAAALGYQRAVWVAPTQPQLIAALQAAGFEPAWEHALYLYEKKQPTRRVGYGIIRKRQRRFKPPGVFLERSRSLA